MAKKVVILVFLFLCSALAQLPDEIHIEGEDEVEGDGSNTVEGEVIEVVVEPRPSSGRSSKAIIGDPLPSFCKYENVKCPSAVTQTDTNVQNVATCMQKCRDDDDCNFFTHNAAAQTCGYAFGDADSNACGANTVPDDLAAAAGTDLYLRKFGIKDPEGKMVEPMGLSPQCKGGVGPVGLPEDNLSSYFCEAKGKYCPYDNPDTLMYSVFAATLFQCKARCTSFENCFQVVWVRSSPHTARMCHMLRKPCEKNELRVDNSVDAVTLFRQDMAMYRTMRDSGGQETSHCPPSTTFYERDMGPPYDNKFCLYPTRVQCPNAEGNMYPGQQNFDFDGCLAACNGYPTCGAVEYFSFKNHDGSVQNKCNMKDTHICTEEELKNSPAPADYVKNQYPNLDADDYDEYKFAIRLKESDAGECPGEFTDDPDKKNWKAKFCIHYDRVCGTDEIADQTVVDATDLKDCLTKCHKSETGCESAAFDEGKCTLINGKCEYNKLKHILFKEYYFKIDLEEQCPTPACGPNSSPKEVPVCPNTCKNPTAENDCDFVTIRCVCDPGHLQDDDSFVCIAEDDCPVNDCPGKSPLEPVRVAEDDNGVIYRYLDFSDANEGDKCGEGATVQVSKPCPNTCEKKDANSLCAIPDAVKSCHCTAADHYWDPENRVCVPADKCPGPDPEFIH